MNPQRIVSIMLLCISVLTLAGCQQSIKVPERQSEIGFVSLDSVDSQAINALQATSVPATGLKAIANVTGKIAFSADGAGSNNLLGTTIQANKPNASATVQKALFACASYVARTINDGDVSLDGTPIIWSQSIVNNINVSFPYFNSVLSDVTLVVKPKIDAAPEGIVSFTQTEVLTNTIDGCALYVIFDDPTQTTDSTVIILFGGQRLAGDTFSVTLAQPIDKTNPKLSLNLSLATSFGYQGNMSTAQYTQVDVNGSRMTSAAGGQDDCDVFALPANECAMNGGLITVGGMGDITGNPTPFAAATADAHSDDELYNLLPFVNDGDTTINISTKNPSDDDNIFAAVILSSISATTTSTNLPPTVHTDHNPVVVNKGETALNTGTFSDGDGDPVTVTASLGTVTQNSTTGIWNWSFDTTNSPTGNQTVIVTAQDSKGASASTSFVLKVLQDNTAPTVSVATNPVIVNEGKKATNVITFSDADGDPVTLSASVGKISDDPVTGIWTWSFNAEDGPDQSQMVTITATDSKGSSTSTTFALTVKNLLPTIDNNRIVVSADSINVNTSLSVSAKFRDGGKLDTHKAQWNWGDGTTSVGTLIQDTGSGSVDNTHIYTKPGTYNIKLTVTDKDGGARAVTYKSMIVINPAAVDGRGRFNSPKGAYIPTLSIAGRADFRITSAYNSGASIPSGEVAFSLSDVRFDFLATTQTSLVIDGSTARVKGTGTVNGAGKFGFLLIVTDGGASTNPDLFRIRIWDINNANALVYDNQKGQAITSNAGTQVSGDSIVVTQ